MKYQEYPGWLRASDVQLRERLEEERVFALR